MNTVKRIALATVLALSCGVVYSQTGQSDGAAKVTATNAVVQVQETVATNAVATNAVAQVPEAVVTNAVATNAVAQVPEAVTTNAVATNAVAQVPEAVVTNDVATNAVVQVQETVSTNAVPVAAPPSGEDQHAEPSKEAGESSAARQGIMGASYVEDLKVWLASKLGMDINGFFFSLVFLFFSIGLLYVLLKVLNLLHWPIRRLAGFWGMVRLLAFVSGSASLWISLLCPDRPWMPFVLMCGLILFTMLIAWMYAKSVFQRTSAALAAVGLVLADCAYIALVVLFSKVLIQEIIMAIVITIGLYVLNALFTRRRK